jgi:CPA2 family monovalent cation:H+ antiporter-2
MEIFTRVLTKYLVPRDEIERLLAELRADGYEMFLSIYRTSASLSDLKLQLQDVDISTFRIAQGSPLIGKTLVQIELRKRYAVSVVAIRRESQILSDRGADTLLHSNDVLFVLGSSEKISEAINTFSYSNKGKERSLTPIS